MSKCWQQTRVVSSLWEDGTEEQTGFAKTKYHDRLRSALAGRRGLGQQTLKIICTGYPDMETAETAIRQRLAALIAVEPSWPEQKQAE